jgi:hypothetical protein
MTIPEPTLDDGSRRRGEYGGGAEGSGEVRTVNQGVTHEDDEYQKDSVHF